MELIPHRSEQQEGTASITGWEILALIAAVVILLSPFVYLFRADHQVEQQPAAKSGFVGSSKCGECHQEAFNKWQGSHHDLAMDEATGETVLGDFNNVVYDDPHNNTSSRFFREQGKFYVETEGPNGLAGIFEITHTFGVYPLQQYLVPFADGRLQCLNIAWDVVQKSWYRLPPYEVAGSDDWLHWTKGGQTWNGMCAECHSTRLEKKFSLETNGYDTKWFEIDVGCEACHGPGENHIAWASRPAMARPQITDYQLSVKTGSIDHTEQIAICAPCHSRRFQLGDNNHEQGELLDKMVPAVLSEGLYFPDGQIQDEVYVYGSFTQSKMFQHGIRCSDCHDMHNLKLHRKGNELCLQCHRADDYDTETHHFHKQEHEGKPSKGYLCVKCHMPGRVYMGNDYRPDHSLRIPRPDLSQKIDVPNSCSTTDCHQDKGLEWVTAHYSKWYGISRKPHYGEVIAAGRLGKPKAQDGLIRLAEDSLQPAIVRATALTLLADYHGDKVISVFTKALEEADALLRYTAIRNLDNLDMETKIKLIEPKLYDQVKAVRIEAAAALVKVPLTALRAENRETFSTVLEEYRKAMLYNSDFAPQRYNLGNLEAALGNLDKAIVFYRQAIGIDGQFYPAKINLAMQLNQRGENQEAVSLFKQVLHDRPDFYEASYSLGLLLGELGEHQEASSYLENAADGMPQYSRARYNYALVLLKQQKWQQGEGAILKALEIEPGNREYFVTLANLYLNFRMRDHAIRLARNILGKVPNHEQAQQLLKAVE